MKKLLAALLCALSLQAWSATDCVNLDIARPGGIGGTGSPQAPGGIGGTGAIADTSGIGGTGAPANGIGGTGAPANGIGGTGSPQMAEGESLGLIGPITGFASICVNGLEVHFDVATPVLENGNVAHVSQLEIGQIVSVEAVATAHGLQARNIGVMHALIGPITAIPSPNTLEVMGNTVIISADDLAEGRVFMVGNIVAVSGLYDSAGRIIATRVDARPNAMEASITAPDHTLASGQWNGTALVASAQRPDASLRLVDKVEKVIIEGLVQQSAPDKPIRVGGFVAVSGNAPLDKTFSTLRPDMRVRMEGKFDQQRRFSVERIQVVERPEKSDLTGNATRKQKDKPEKYEKYPRYDPDKPGYDPPVKPGYYPPGRPGYDRPGRGGRY